METAGKTGGLKKRIARNISLAGILDVSGALATTTSGILLVLGEPQWKMIIHEDFSPGNTVSALLTKQSCVCQ